MGEIKNAGKHHEEKENGDCRADQTAWENGINLHDKALMPHMVRGKNV